jgi:DNA helicase-2/ATP-dependent DNA helicase PcrA
MEEERRLCYVGMTRAREHLFLTNACRRRTFGQEQYNPPSRFIGDIPKELLDLEDAYQPGFGFGYDRGDQVRGTQNPDSRPIAPGNAAGNNLAAVFSAGANSETSGEVQVIPEEPEGLYIGMRVRHGKFGVGTIRGMEGKGDDLKATVWFNSVGRKKLLLRFAGLERA